MQQSMLSEIQRSISLKRYELAITSLETYIRKIITDEETKKSGLDLDLDLGLGICMDILKAICDKSDLTIKISLKIASWLSNHKEYWIREDSLQILQKLYRSMKNDEFDTVIESCESKLFDVDNKVREAAVGLISTVLQSSLQRYPDLYLTYCQMFEDESWRVRAQALGGVLDFLTPEADPSTDLIEAFTEKIAPLLRDTDEEIRGLAAEVLKKLFIHMDARKITLLLLPILNDIDFEIRAKGLWITGEIGALYFDEFSDIFHRLVEMFSDKIMMVQTKTIDAFVKIGQKKGKNLLHFFRSFIISGKTDQLEGISESLIIITIQQIKEYLPFMINDLADPHPSIRNVIGSCLKKIYIERSDAFEEEIFRMFVRLNPDDWRQRKRTIALLGDLSYLLHSPSMSVWTAINLQSMVEMEQDLDVLDEIEASLTKIRNVYPKIDTKIQEIEERKENFYDGLKVFQEMTRNLRLDAEKLIQQKKFYEAEVLLEEQGSRISEKLDDYENLLQRSEFKRFSVEVVQDFKENKEEILENISDVKNSMFMKICDGRADYLETLQEIITHLRNRIDVVKAEYESIQEIEEKLIQMIDKNEMAKTEAFLDSLSKIRRKIYTLEFDIGQTWLQNLEFKEFLKEITIYWVDVKIEIQQYLGNIFQKFNSLQMELTTETENETFSILKKKITYDFLNNNLQNVILQAIQNQREVLEQFDSIVDPILQKLTQKKFKEARQLKDLTLSNLFDSIENFNREINKIYEDIDKVDLSISSSNDIRAHLKDWDGTKNLLIDRIQTFKDHIESQILTEEIKEYLKYMNPISLVHLSKALIMDIDILKEYLFQLIQDHEIHAVVRNDELLQPEVPQGENFLTFFRKVEIVGTKIVFKLRIYNPTKFFISDIGLMFLYPLEILHLQKGESDPVDIFIKEFEPEAIRVIRWEFRLNKADIKTFQLKKWLLNINYRNPFGKITSHQKESDIIL
jgi:hypothetical protein